MEKLKVIIKISEKEFDAQEPYSIRSTENKTPINEVIDWLTSSKENGATHISWRARCQESYGSCESDEVELQTIFEREETDEEYTKRLIEAEFNKLVEERMRLEKEKTQYLKLKAKFEGK